jgi:hypothetical protein
LDHYNFDVAIPELAEHRSVPTRWMHTPEELQAVRDQRQQAKAAQQAVDVAPAGATVAAAAIKANTRPGSAP